MHEKSIVQYFMYFLNAVFSASEQHFSDISQNLQFIFDELTAINDV